jgi:hypothetical protein
LEQNDAEDAGSNPEGIPTNGAAGHKESGVAFVGAINSEDAAPVAVQMPVGVAVSDKSKSGAPEPRQFRTNGVAASPVPSEVQTTQVEHAEIKTESSPVSHAIQNEHAIPVLVTAAVSPQALPSAEPNGVHAAGIDETTASLSQPRAQHAAEGSGNIGVNPYQTLDQGAAAPSAVFHGGANRVAVGVHDPSLGWLEIKTQSTAGQVTAALVTTSSQTHDHLAAQLPSLAQFLAEREVKVGSMAVEQQPAGGSNSSQTGAGEERDSNAQRGDRQTSSDFNSSSTLTSPGIDADESFEERPLSYISVRA